MIYHKNRLILRWHKLDKIHHGNKSSKYMGVVAVFDAPFLEANPMKNDFLKEGKLYEEYQRLMNWMVDKIRWYGKNCKIDVCDGGAGIAAFWSRVARVRIPTMIQCDNSECLKWRRWEDEKNLPSDTWQCDDCNEEEDPSTQPQVMEAPPKRKRAPRKKVTKSDEKEPTAKRGGKKKRKVEAEDDDYEEEEKARPSTKGTRASSDAAAVKGEMDLDTMYFYVTQANLIDLECHSPDFTFEPSWFDIRDDWYDSLRALKPHQLPQLIDCLLK
jgi:hypothetical protein